MVIFALGSASPDAQTHRFRSQSFVLHRLNESASLKFRVVNVNLVDPETSIDRFMNMILAYAQVLCSTFRTCTTFLYHDAPSSVHHAAALRGQAAQSNGNEDVADRKRQTRQARQCLGEA